MKIHKVEQMSKEWFECRKKHLTASHAQEISTGKIGLESYVIKLMSEFCESTPEEKYTNNDLERGIELEEQARDIYELENNCKIEEVGFIEEDEFTGCSPDGLIGKDGGIEIKCHNNLNHFKILIQGEKGIPSKYIWQIQMNLMITKRKWFDYVAYNPNFSKSLIVFRIKPDLMKFEKLLMGLEKGKNLIKDYENRYNKIINN